MREFLLQGGSCWVRPRSLLLRWSGVVTGFVVVVHWWTRTYLRSVREEEPGEGSFLCEEQVSCVVCMA